MNSKGRLRNAAIGFTALASLMAGCGMFGTNDGSQESQATSFPDPEDMDALYKAALDEGGEIVWYYGSAAEPMRAIAKQFEKEYPGMKVNGNRLVGVEQYQKFVAETEAGQHTADAIFLNDYPGNQDLIKRGFLADWKVPTFDRIGKEFKSGVASYAPWLTDIAIIYNRKNVSKEEVNKLASGWTGILDPAFKGRFAVTTQRGTTSYAALQLFTDPTMEEELGGPDFLKRVAANDPTVYGDVLVLLDRVLAGDEDIAFTMFEAIGVTKYLQGAPIGWVRPEPTPVWAGSWSSISANAPHPNSARLWQNWFLSEKGADAMESVYGAASTLEGRTDTRKVAEEPWYRPLGETRGVDYKRWSKDFESTFVEWESILKGANKGK